VRARSPVMNKTTTERSILRVDKSAGCWEAIPTSLVNDARLGFDTRGFAAWLLTRPPGWQIRASALPQLLRSRSRHVGRDRARRFLRELERAGYLTRTRHRTADGRWIWEHAFRPNSAVSSIDAFSGGGSGVDGLTVDGLTVDGKHVDLIHTLNSSRSDYSILNKTTTTTTAPKPVVVVGDLMGIRYPNCLGGRRLESAKKLMTQCPAVDRQAVLDEFSAMLRDTVVRHPMGLLNRLVERAKAGQFVPNRSLAGSPTRTASNGNPTRSAVNGSASSSSSQPRIASEIAEQTPSKWRPKPGGEVS
jgi:hypothetical protein